MQLELQDELQVHDLGTRKESLLQQLVMGELPRPPVQAFHWPGIDSKVGDETWFYYLTETMSRRILLSIKNELHFGKESASDLNELD